MVRTIIISGGTSGIGLAAAKILSREGARTILLGRDTERGKKAEESVEAMKVARKNMLKYNSSFAEGLQVQR